MKTDEMKFNKVMEILNKNSNDPNKLITILQDVQEEYRYLPEDIDKYVKKSQV